MNFIVSCPGKTILHGEHSVVYGKPALAAAIGLRNNVYVTVNTSDVVEFNFAKLNCKFSLNLLDINNFIKYIKNNVEQNLNEIDDQIILDQIKKIISCNGDENQNLTKISASFLCFGIFAKSLDEIRNGFNISMESEIKIGAGLGSSASFGVGLAAALLVLSNQIKDIENLTDDDRNLISNWGLRSERIIHGNPSGVDNTVCTFGNIIKFTKGYPFEKIILKKKINILLVDSNVSRNTIKLVKNVAEMKEKYSNILNHIFDAMGELVNSAIPAYKESQFDDIKNFFQINNNLLRAIGVSHNKLELIFNIALKHNFGSKLTGAGGGGFALILLPENYSDLKEYLDLCIDLKAANFEYIPTILGDDGLKFSRF